MKIEMICNAIAYNKYLNRNTLDSMNFDMLCAFVHPIDRDDFIKRFNLGENF